jgi:hypothetical protein
VIIDVDAFEYEEILKQPTTSVSACEGYAMIFQMGNLHIPHIPSLSMTPSSFHGTMH